MPGPDHADLGFVPAAAGSHTDIGFVPTREEPGAGEAFARGGAQGATLGFGDEIQGAVQAVGQKVLPESMGGIDYGKTLLQLYRESRDAMRKENAAAEEAHPGAYLAGNVAGGLVTAPALPGGAVRSLGGAAAAGAGLGAAAGLGGSNADLTHGEVGKAALDTAVGAAAGAAAGAAGHKLLSSVPAAAGTLGDEAKDLAQRKAVNALRPTAGEVKTLVQRGELNDVGESLLRNKVVETGDTFTDIATKAQGVREGAGKALGEALEALDKTGAPGLSKKGVIDALLDKASEASAEGPAMTPIADRFRAAAESIAKSSGGETLTFTEAEAWKRGFQKIAFPKGKPPLDPSPVQIADQEIAAVVRQHVEEQAEKAAQAVGGDVAQQFLQAKQAFGTAAKAAGMAEGALGRQEARNIASPSDKSTALAGLVAGAMMGRPVAGAVVGATGAVVNNVVRNRAASTVAGVADNAADKLLRIAQTNPAQLGKYGAILSGALQRGGQNAFNAHLYVLGQADPEFQTLQKKLSEAQ